MSSLKRSLCVLSLILAMGHSAAFADSAKPTTHAAKPVAAAKHTHKAKHTKKVSKHHKNAKHQTQKVQKVSHKVAAK